MVFTDIFEDLVSPAFSATEFFVQACSKRKGTLDPVMGVCVQILDTPAGERDPSKKDGALYVIGKVAETLMKVSVTSNRCCCCCIILLCCVVDHI